MRGYPPLMAGRVGPELWDGRAGTIAYPGRSARSLHLVVCGQSTPAQPPTAVYTS
ncbi:hypothetical protein CHLRE_02g142406v5 [Chlamydomonas reinhardtii]|uniref:Uncharacterized protein n=1 Tax=Chlamydomonas reinhardtii TaxID=3055 RepID=A0A2K3E4E4_CHLRE|nr:uncharacterized protein CHLRE_02g142406v5 [Chlamydomonas reinhardtii]PNW87660.1 hypothetical protein CHLRE_02g142406v5 [Chlamydomonas reinhardtii]